jgi:hypothetical protein
MYFGYDFTSTLGQVGGLPANIGRDQVNGLQNMVTFLKEGAELRSHPIFQMYSPVSGATYTCDFILLGRNSIVTYATSNFTATFELVVYPGGRNDDLDQNPPGGVDPGSAWCRNDIYDNLNGKELQLKVKNKEGQTILKNIKWDSGKKVFVDAIDENKVIQCAGGSGTGEEYTLGAGGSQTSGDKATVGEAKAFLTGPTIGFTAPISFNGEATLFDQDSDTLADGTYTFTDSTTVENSGPLTGQIKITGKKIEYIPA